MRFAFSLRVISLTRDVIIGLKAKDLTHRRAPSVCGVFFFFKVSLSRFDAESLREAPAETSYRFAAAAAV